MGKNGHKAEFAGSVPFAWTPERTKAVLGLAEGKTQQEVADEVGISRTSICNWLCQPDFAAEVDRLSLMVHVASRAERLRLAMRVVRAKTKNGVPETDKDLLEWLKFAQSETDGTKLDLTKLSAALGDTEAPLADRGQVGAAESQAVN